MESQQGSLPSYYSILGVSIDSSADDIRRAYRKLAMQWHPDRWTRTPSLLGEAKQKFQQIQEAYSVLSDQRKRTLYDVGLYDPDEEEDEGYCDFLEEMMSLMAQNKDKKYSMDELQAMFVEMTQGFGFSWWPCGPSVVRDSGYSESMQRGFGFADGEKSRRAEMADVWSRQLLQIGDEALSMWTIHHDTRPPIHPSLMTSDSSFWVPRFGN